MLELLGRLGAALGISLLLTVLLLALYQDHGAPELQPESTSVTQASR